MQNQPGREGGGKKNETVPYKISGVRSKWNWREMKHETLRAWY